MLRPTNNQSQQPSSKTRVESLNNHKLKHQKPFHNKKPSAQTVYERMIRARAASALNLVENETQSSARGLQQNRMSQKNDQTTKSREF